MAADYWIFGFEVTIFRIDNLSQRVVLPVLGPSVPRPQPLAHPNRDAGGIDPGQFWTGLELLETDPLILRLR